MQTGTEDQIRKRVRRAAARFLKHHRAIIARDTQSLRRERDRVEQLHAQTLAIHQANIEKERELSDLFQLLETRTAYAEQLEASAEREQRQLETRRAALQAELTGLETRIANARANLDKAQVTVALVPAPASQPWNDVALEVPAAVSSQVMQLEAREMQLRNEQRELATARRALQVQAEQVADQRAVLIEQLGRVLSSEQQWQRDELQTVNEIEALARQLQSHEATGDERERRVWRYQSTLQQWHHAIAEGQPADDMPAIAERDGLAVRELDGTIGLVELDLV